MKRNYILASSFIFFSLFGKSQNPEGAFKKEILKKTEVEFLYNHYIQDGDNSAVTGGVGTEKLTVVAPQLSLRRVYQNASSMFFKFGADVITSASTDKIDFIKSSASIRDARTHLDVVYSRQVMANVSASIGSGFSIESDYFSLPLSVGLSISDKNGLRSYGINFQSHFDDLRWGRLSNSFMPETLVYPAELRDTKWFNEHKRNSYNLKFSLVQDVGKRNRIGIYPEISYQSGLLSTPFHRVYFNDGSLKVEKLPSKRWKTNVGLKLNSFVGGRTILKNALDFYSDNFLIRGLSIENETAIKITHTFVLAPSVRIYFQQGSKYFSGYRSHSVEERFYTSDYDLSTMKTFKAGLAIRHNPIAKNGHKTRGTEISYSVFNRSDGLLAHIISCAWRWK